MTGPALLAALEALSEKLGVVVRYEPFDAKIARRGGFCRVSGRPMIVLDPGLPILDKVGILASALRGFDLDDVYIAPALRSWLEREKPRVIPLARPRPIARARKR